MRIRLTKVDEYQLLTCLQHGLWGASTARFKDWRIGDGLAIIVDKKLAAFAQVVAAPFLSHERVWDNGEFPHRIKVIFTHFLKPEDRPPILGEIREVLTKLWGPKYGWGILNQVVIEDPDADIIIRAISYKHNALGEYTSKLPAYLEDARTKRGQVEQKPLPGRRGRPRKVEPVLKEGPAEEVTDTPIAPDEESVHTKMQAALTTLGRATGCSVWIASNDQSKTYKGKPLSEDALRKLPSLGLNEEATKRISLIDVIWISQRAPVCAFEIETSTSIYSGLLRMSDLLAVVPALNISIFIVAPKARHDKVMSELARPTFRNIGLNEYCRFISTEDLDDLMSKVSGLDGHIQTSILDKIAESLEEEEDIE
jgi:hypothetical protein